MHHSGRLSPLLRDHLPQMIQVTLRGLWKMVLSTPVQDKV
jgi:hypothetical protein